MNSAILRIKECGRHPRSTGPKVIQTIECEVELFELKFDIAESHGGFMLVSPGWNAQVDTQTKCVPFCFVSLYVLNSASSLLLV